MNFTDSNTDMPFSLYPTVLQNPAPFPSLSQGTFSPAYVSSFSCCLSELSRPHCCCCLPTQPDCTSPHFEFPRARSLCSLRPTLLLQSTHLHSCKVEGEETILFFDPETDLEVIFFPPFPKCYLDIPFQEISFCLLRSVCPLPACHLLEDETCCLPYRVQSQQSPPALFSCRDLN